MMKYHQVLQIAFVDVFGDRVAERDLPERARPLYRALLKKPGSLPPSKWEQLMSELRPVCTAKFGRLAWQTQYVNEVEKYRGKWRVPTLDELLKDCV